MRLSLLYTALAVFIILSLSECKKDDENIINPGPPSCQDPIKDTAEAMTSILGEWKWVLTYTLVKGQTNPLIETSENMGDKRLIFSADRSVERIEKNEPGIMYQYRIDKSGTDSSLYIYFVKTVDNFTDPGILLLCHDSLIIDNSYDDSGGKELYIKKK